MEKECGPESNKCPHCEKRKAELAQSEEVNMAILIALVPAMTVTLFSGLGLL